MDSANKLGLGQTGSQTDADENQVLKNSLDTSVILLPSNDNRKDITIVENVKESSDNNILFEEENNNSQDVLNQNERAVVLEINESTSKKDCVVAVEVEAQKNQEAKACDVTVCNPKELFEYKAFWTWICFDRKYKMSSSFESKTFCAEFTSKILVFKAIQFLTVASWTMIAQSDDALADIMEKNFWTFFIALFVFLMIYFSARLTNVIKSIPQATCGYVLSTISLCHICASIFIHWATFTVPIILLTLVFSYIVVCIFFLGFTKVDVKRQDIFVPIVISTIIYSLISYAAIMLIHDASRVVQEFGGIWLPSMMISLLVATGEMQEVQKLLHGLRLPLNDNEWIIATNNVL